MKREGTKMTEKIPKILVDSFANGNWKQVSPNVLRRCLGEELDDLKLFENLDMMRHASADLDHGGYVDDPEFCMARKQDIGLDDPRLEFARALFIGGSIIPGDDVFVAIRLEDSEEYDPSVLVLDWRNSAPNRWTKRGNLSDLICGIGSECSTN